MSENYDRIYHLMDNQRGELLHHYATVRFSAQVVDGEVTILHTGVEQDYYGGSSERDEIEKSWCLDIKGTMDKPAYSAATLEAREIFLAHVFHHLVRDWQGKTFYLEFDGGPNGSKGWVLEILDHDRFIIQTVNEKELLFAKFEQGT